MFKKIFFIIFIIIVAGVSGIFAERYLFPRLATTEFFSKYEFLKKTAENTTIINKTEQVYVTEDTSISKITSPVVSSIVNIISYSDSKVVKNGTGAIATSDGIIITYADAVSYKNPLSKTDQFWADKYKILTSDGNVYDGELLTVDSWSNLAFIKINASNLPVVPFRNSDEYKSGEKLIAFSNNGSQYQNKFSLGILSGFIPDYNISGKALSVPEKLEGIFLADFNRESLSPGSIAIDYSGQTAGLIGKIEKNGQSEYFIIPSNKIKVVLDKVINKKINANPLLGLYYLPLSPSYVLINNLKTTSGALIFSPSGQQGLAIIAGSPAAKAGLKLNDIITKVNDENIDLNHNLSDILYKYKKGDSIELTVVRNEQEMKVKVQL